MTTTAGTTTEVATGLGRHAGAPAAADHEADLEMERLVEAGVPSGLPAGLGDNQGILVLGSHRADPAELAEPALSDPPSPTSRRSTSASTSTHLPWRLVLTSVLAVLVVLALAFVALDALASAWTVGGRPA